MKDLAQRAQAIEPTGSYIVQAPAGSGKTTLLTQRFLALLAGVEQPEEIIAVTFTVKAAREMQTRIQAALFSAANEPPPECPHALAVYHLASQALARDKRQRWELLRNPNRLRIMTIDALAAYLAKQLPLLSGISSGSQVTDDANVLYQQAARRLFDNLDDSSKLGQALGQLLLHLDNHLGRAEHLLVNLLAQRDQWLPFIMNWRNTPDLRQRLSHSLTRVNKHLVSQLRQQLSAAQYTELTDIAHFALLHLANTEGVDDTAVLANPAQWQTVANCWLSQKGDWRKSLTKRQGFPASSDAKDKAEKALFKQMKQRAQDLIAEMADDAELLSAWQGVQTMPPDYYHDSQWQAIDALLTVLPYLAATLQLVFAGQKSCDFSEVSLSALQALGDAEHPTDLALHLDYAIKHVLVDEFQDTSSNQYELILGLTRGFTPGDGRSVFVVGDPMQSIYRFRKADVGLFLRTWQNGLGDLPLTPLRLRSNFRSTQGIVDWVNACFSRICPHHDDISRGAIAYQSAVAANIDASPAVFTYSHLDETSEQEAHTIVDIITQTQRQTPEKSIAILVRSRHHLQAILPALKQAHIAYQATDIESLANTPICRDLLALTRALVQPADRTAWLACLRAPWCGLTLSDLWVIAHQRKAYPLIDRLKHAGKLPLSASGKQRALSCYEKLHFALKNRRRSSLRKTVENTWRALGGPACLSHADEFTYANSFFQLLERLDEAGDCVDLAQLDAGLARLTANTTSEAPNPVHIMTIHKSKGLEFDVVLLPGLNRRLRGDEQRLLYWLEFTLADSQELLISPIRHATEMQSPHYQFLQTEDQYRARFEAIRLLYVAATRARSQLHLLASFNEVSAEHETLNPQPQSALGLWWPYLQDSFGLPTNSQRVAQPAQPSEPIQPNLMRLRQLPQFELSFSLQSKTTSRIDLATLNSHSLAQTIGNETHLWLQHLADHTGVLPGIDDLPQITEQIARRLQRLGLTLTDYQTAHEAVVRCIGNTLSCERGRWILGAHPEAYAEYPLSCQRQAGIEHYVIDRLIRDSQGALWIIDYKVSIQDVSDETDFFATYSQRYLPQLTNYAQLVAQHFQQQPHIGLYFPYQAAWWSPALSDDRLCYNDKAFT